MTRIVMTLIAAWCGGQTDVPDLDKLARQLRDDDPLVRRQAAGDLHNNEYRNAPPERLIPLLVETLKTPATGDMENHVAQGFVMEHLSRRFGPKAAGALPHLLKMVTDDKLSSYVRGHAIEALTYIAPGDERVVAALIAAIENPNPTSTSGVHDRAIGALSLMGKAAWPAKKAIATQLEHPWYRDGAFIALGKLALTGETLTTDAAFKRLAEVDRLSVEEASAVFLKLAEIDKKDRARGDAARQALWPVVDAHGNNLIGRAALRALVEIGPGSSVAAAKIIVRSLFTPWDPKKGDIARTAEAALLGFDVKDKEVAPVFAAAFEHALKNMGRWPNASNLSRTLARFGPDARSAAPHVIKALRSVPEYQLSGWGRDLLEAYTELAAVLGSEPGVRAVILELLAPDSKPMKTAGEYRWAVESRLLGTLGLQGLPADGPERAAVLARIAAGLRGGHRIVVAAAARAIQQNPKLRPEEVRELLPLLTRVLAFDFKFPPDAGAEKQPWLGTFEDREPLVEGQRAVIQALAALGPAARDALPVLEAWAKRPLEPRVSDYLPEPVVNQAIREAAVAVKAVKVVE